MTDRKRLTSNKEGSFDTALRQRSIPSLRTIGEISVALIALCLTISPYLTPLFIPPLGTSFTYFGWTGISPPYMGKGLRVAIVKPVFSATAYSATFGGPDSFYQFYYKHGNDPSNASITTDLNLLNVSVTDGWGWSEKLDRYVMSYVGDYGVGSLAAQSLTVVTDINITEGSLFNRDGSRRFDTAVLGFTEYATSQEYNDFQRFVASGGRLVMMDASSFVAEVKYYPQTNHLALVRGHGWAFNGTKAWKSDPFYRWKDQNANLVGSNQCCSTQNNTIPCDTLQALFAARKYTGANVTGDYPISLALKQRFGSVIFQCYLGHEENSVTNMTDTTILAHWRGATSTSQNRIVAYLHQYINGTVVNIGVMSSDVVDRDASVQFFLVSSVQDST